jgi:prolipoprotein diacylglyceryl transferase
MALLFIRWNPDPEIFHMGDFISLRWYGLLFVLGLSLGYLLVENLYRKEGLPLQKVSALGIYVCIGTMIGARLGHCLFYNPAYFLAHPLEMILPVQFINGSMRITGFQGLASHGGAIGVAIAIYLYCRKYKEDYGFVLDKIAVATPLVGGFIRLANLMNSEILGVETTAPWAFIFERVDSIPRHPAQLYEALSYFALFVAMLYIYQYTYRKYKNGWIFGIFIFSLFLIRFLIEFLKISQESFEDKMILDMGQILSLPFIAWGLLLMITKSKKQPIA